MAPKRLTTDEMVHVSTAWVDKKSPARKAIEATPELAPLAPRLDAAHAAILAAIPKAEDPRLPALSAEAVEEDLRHDAILRGIHGLLSALAVLSSDEAATTAYLELRDFLLPEGLAATQKTYRAEAGQAERLAARLTPAVTKQLKAIKADGGTLTGFVDEWLAKAKRLGQIEDERAKLSAPALAESAGQALVTARNRWIRAVNALAANAEAAELDAKTDHLIFGAYRQAEKTAARRKGAVATAEKLEAAPDAAPPA